MMMMMMMMMMMIERGGGGGEEEEEEEEEEDGAAQHWKTQTIQHYSTKQQQQQKENEKKRNGCRISPGRIKKLDDSRERNGREMSTSVKTKRTGNRSRRWHFEHSLKFQPAQFEIPAGTVPKTAAQKVC